MTKTSSTPLRHRRRLHAAPLLSLALLAAPRTTSAFSTTTTPIEKTPVVICPGFGNDSIDYSEPLGQPRDVGLLAALERRGFDPDLLSTVPVRRADWIRVAGGLFDPNFYRCQALPTGAGYGWYIRRLRDAVDAAYESSGGERVLLVGHSAGGWLARAALGDGTWCEERGLRSSDRVRCLATVGAIHKPPAGEAGPGSCVTRGALAFTDASYPGAYLAEEGIGYVSVGGDAIVGDNEKKDRKASDTDADRLYEARGEGSASRVAFTSYEAVCGRGDVSGDGVVPVDWSLLEGSRQIYLDGVLHSINEAGTTIPTDRWYGSEGVLDRWLPTVLDEARISTNGLLRPNGERNDFGIFSLQQWASQRVAEAQEALQAR